MPGRRAPEEARREQIVNAAYAVALRTGIAGVTLRAVASEAGLSHGLLLFHLERKDELIAALLDRVLATTTMPRPSDDAVAGNGAAAGDGRRRRRTPPPPSPQPPPPSDRLGALLRQELERLAHDPRGMRLFFEYWALGVRQTAVRQKIAAALARYRAAFRSLAEEMLPADADVTPDALAAVAVSLISGCAVQAMIDPDRFDTAAYLTVAEGLVERLARGSGGTAAAAASGASRVRRGARKR